ncbi:DUF3089 domain-containing protein [Hymenobacter aerilatus]|uniref:DUF3089 domain-containing protein n=1 Tax=Hymenobacter aerilatus TaxID=2932251 RepID=A0A8T9SXG5_9BACT|nr:DUF3089 domain-containing protein [Hymenobacter aerilatus]UOR05423.1 DUF3089 domain-containing protein [Hymenobacter aerilatus]
MTNHRNLRRGFGVSLLLLMGVLSSCLKLLKPGHPISKETPPSPPIYSDSAAWAALPTRPDSADTVPYGSDLRDQQQQASADVFFVHPTTYYGRKSWNAALDNDLVNKFTDREVIRKQASVFNAAGRIYAPRYRQATLYAFFEKKRKHNGEKALDLAYTDVKASFEYYLAHYNQNRPIILASHSQGTVLATRLLREFFDQDPALRRRLVAAYLIGYKVPATTYQVLRPCADSTQTGCYVSWNAVNWRKPFPRFEGGVAVNPLTWTTDTAYAPATLNQGSVPQSFDRIDRGVADAKVHNGLLWLHDPAANGYTRVRIFGHHQLHYSFHLVDYGLYYINLRRNAQTRVRAWELTTEQ